VILLEFGRGIRRQLQVLCIGAHCDEIEIGCSATLLSLQKSRPACRIHWAVLCSTTQRRVENALSMRAFVRAKCRGGRWTGELVDGRLPGQFPAAKSFLEDVRKRCQPDVIFSPWLEDRHQDHRVVGELAWQVFRDHLILEYEIPKYEGDLRTPNAYVPVSSSIAARKARTIVRTYRSQRKKYWFNEDTFLSLMRLRGLECRSQSGLAEGFHCRKLVLRADGTTGGRAPAGMKTGS